MSGGTVRKPRGKPEGAGTGGGTCVITGAASGLGLETAKQLAAAGMAVIGVDRETPRCRAAEETIRAAAPRAVVGFVAADLSSLGAVRQAALVVREALPEGRLDRLIHTAAIVTTDFRSTAEGHELQLTVNYLAPFLLTAELFPALVRPQESRVIAASSSLHRKAAIAWGDPMMRRSYDGLKAYRQSKLALVMFVLELNRRVAFRFPVRGLAVETEVTETPRAGASHRAVKGARPARRTLSPADAAAAVARLALSPPATLQDDYWHLGRPVRPSLYARNAGAAGRLWRLSETLCGVRFL
jgi:NAD(P)-dependent dehydrogenase (short-subunit alcohol dehydrogenase family)